MKQLEKMQGEDLGALEWAETFLETQETKAEIVKWNSNKSKRF